jgi:hypothetical protein
VVARPQVQVQATTLAGARAGRRTGGRGVASTLFAREQSAELYNSERTLGIRMERMSSQMNPSEVADYEQRMKQDRNISLARGKMIRLPGEFLPAQM